jgi:O-antigen ligase
MNLKEIVGFAQKHILIIFFFLLSTLCLFLGDGKQTVVDLVGAGGILGMCLITKFYLKPQRQISPSITISFGALLLYLIIRTIFSDDVGYSIFATARYVEAFLVYSMFYRYSSSDSIVVYINFIFGFAVFALISALCFVFESGKAAALPLMNLFYPTYGHNHVVDVFLFAFPISAYGLVVLKKKTWGVVSMLLIGGTVFSLSRLAIVVEAVLFAFLVLYNSIKTSKVQVYLLVVSFILIGLSAIMFFGTQIQNNTLLAGVGVRFIKQPIFQDGRWSYWREAVVAFFERPWFGAGPGTFSLLSKRYQTEPAVNSWFAHSYLLETLSETGLIGLFLVLLWGFFVIRSVRRGLKSGTHLRLYNALGLAIVVVFIYAAFDYTLEYLIIWLMFWACLGIFVPQTTPAYDCLHERLFILVDRISLGIVVWFYLIMIGAAIYPQNVELSLIYPGKISQINLKNAGAINVSVARWLHRRNPFVINAVDGICSSLEYDPQNTDSLKECIGNLQKQQNQKRLLDVVKIMVNTLTQNKVIDIYFINQQWPQISPCFNADTLLWKETPVNDYQAKSFYYAGLCLIKLHQPDNAVELLRIAANARPGWSNIYLDYAVFLERYFHNHVLAQQALDLCKKNIYAQKHCNSFNLNTLPWASLTDPKIILSENNN